MDTQQLIEQIENAEDKDALEKLGVEHFGIDVDKRKGKETIRTELLERADAAEDGQASEAGEPASTQDGEGTTQPYTQPESGKPESGAQSYTAKRKNRTLKNTHNGRLFVWTAALAKLPHMKEV